jgi:hypothetical protein
VPVRERREKQERGEATDYGNSSWDHSAQHAVGVSDRGHRPKEQGNETKSGRDISEVLPKLESIIELIAGRGDEHGDGQCRTENADRDCDPHR